MTDFQIAVFDGDGIGPEIMAPTIDLLSDLAAASGEFSFQFKHLPAGAAHYAVSGDALPAASISAARAADAILLSAMGLPDIRKPDGTELTPQIDIRFELGLYAGVRPVKIWPGQPTPLSAAWNDQKLSEVDFVLVRESTEGLFAHMHEGVVTETHATETLRITRATSEKLFDFSFKLAQQRAARLGRPGRVTCVDKANVFRSFAFFRSIFEERAKAFPDIATDAAYVDAMAMWMVQKPRAWDVMVTENMFGDILSDLGAALMGSLGLAPSADIGDNHAVFQPCHGSAPDIAGKGLANPLAMILSAAMMLDWLADKHAEPALAQAARKVETGIGALLKDGTVLTGDLGGTATLADIVTALRGHMAL
ncbi:MAG: isocitrate/isopropylmalate family dehydrogenase [Pseudomonadota bacterium]